MKPLLRCTACLLVFSAALLAQSSPAVLTINAGKATGQASPILYGLMTEEINHSYDGGLYAELVQNRAFLDNASSPVHWSLLQPAGASAQMNLDPAQPLSKALPTSLRLEVSQASAAHPAGVANDGYWGIPVYPHTQYRASFYAKAAAGFQGPVLVSIQGDDGKVYASGKVAGLTSHWKQYHLVLKTGDVQETAHARYVLALSKPGKVWFGLVSLFPPTWHNQPNGFRPDLMQMLVDMHPKFLRLPGGNYLEGNTIATRFEWKKTIGPLIDRPGHQGPWGYRSSDGLGLLEYLQWCENMHAEPVLAVYAGYSLGGEHVSAGPALQPYVQDALDEIEYVTGPVTSKWGAQRAKDGHPRPFPLHYVEIGNEDEFDHSGSYPGRFTQFYRAIKARYPSLICIWTDQHGKFPAGIRPAMTDEHYYEASSKFLSDTAHFDHYDRKGPKIFVGEWAAYETSYPPWDKRSRKQPPTPDMKAALADASWMTGMERNSDLVKMNAYAPLLVNVNPGGRQWRPNLIGYDALHVFGSPSYYAIKMFSTNFGNQLLGTQLNNPDLHASVTRDSRTGTIFVKIVNPQAQAESVQLRLTGALHLRRDGEAITMAAAPDATNSITERTNVVPKTSRVTGVKPQFTYTLPADSITVLRLYSK